jgi:hypothetical protein
VAWRGVAWRGVAWRGGSETRSANSLSPAGASAAALAEWGSTTGQQRWPGAEGGQKWDSGVLRDLKPDQQIPSKHPNPTSGPLRLPASAAVRSSSPTPLRAATPRHATPRHATPRHATPRRTVSVTIRPHNASANSLKTPESHFWPPSAPGQRCCPVVEPHSARAVPDGTAGEAAALDLSHQTLAVWHEPRRGSAEPGGCCPVVEPHSARAAADAPAGLRRTPPGFVPYG